MNKFKQILILFLSCTMLLSCATTTTDPRDPYEAFNRKIYTFNDKVDHYIFKPTATVYKGIVPSPVRESATNFFDNLYMLPTVANDILQVRLNDTMTDLWRFIINSTFGVAGLFDVATKFGLPEHYNDMGITLAKWGHQDSSYIILPFLGPSTFRDVIGNAVDYNFFTLYPYLKPDRAQYELLGYNFINTRANLLASDKVVEHAAFDPYVFMRDAYLQYRDNLINDGQDSSEDLYIENNDGDLSSQGDSDPNYVEGPDE